ncbi:MAG: hypothetical protein E6K64_05085 [Nitrospirae bacterium]|nr:MAG: hypothetical protein E6K64_05085 [Nitrospirota bacterium]
MTTTAPPQTTLTRAQIETAIAALQPVQRVMVRLLLLPYLDPTPEDIVFMARERSEPNMRAGLKQGGRSQVAHDKISGLPKDWIVAVETKVQQFQTQLRSQLTRLNLLADFLTDCLAGLQLEITATEQLLASECEIGPESLEDLRAQAKLSPLTYALKKLAARADKGEIEEADYVRERLSLEYQARLRQRDRFKKRLNLVLLERQASILSSLSDEFLAEIWCIAVGPITNRRVKAVQAYVNALASTLKSGLDAASFAAAVNAGLGPRLAGGSKNEGIGSKPVDLAGDLWTQTILALAADPIAPITPKPCEHPEGGTKGLTAKLRSLAIYELGEDEEVKMWPRTVQCLNCLTVVRAAQQESGIVGRSLDEVVVRVKTRSAFPRKEAAPAAQEAAPAPEAEALDLEERLRPFIGDDAGQVGAKSW